MTAKISRVATGNNVSGAKHYCTVDGMTHQADRQDLFGNSIIDQNTKQLSGLAFFEYGSRLV